MNELLDFIYYMLTEQTVWTLRLMTIGLILLTKHELDHPREGQGKPIFMVLITGFCSLIMIGELVGIVEITGLGK